MKNFETDSEMLQLLAQRPAAFLKVLFRDSERIKAMLKRLEFMPQSELLERAFRIKPLVRMYDGRKLNVAEECPDSYLVYSKPFDVRESYYFDFKPQHAVRGDDGKPLTVEGVKEVGRFICYHRYGGYWMFIRPGVDEVLLQLPAEFVGKQVDAFEIKFSSTFCSEVWSQVLDMHVSTVILYALEKGLPEAVKRQNVIIDGKTYRR